MPRLNTYFSITQHARSELRSLIEQSDAQEAIKTFIRVIAEQYVLAGCQPVSRENIVSVLRKEKPRVGVSKASMAMRERELLELHVMIERKGEVENSQINIREVISLKPLMKLKDAEESSPIKKGVQKKMSHLILQSEADDLDVGILSVPDGNFSRVDALHTGILDGAVRLSGKDGSKRIHTTYQYGAEVISISTYTTTEERGEISILSDYRAVRCLNEMYVEFVESKYGPLWKLSDEVKANIGGDFLFDVYDLCEAMGMRRTDVSARYVTQMLERLMSTEFKIESDEAPEFRRKFTRGAHEMRVRYLTEVRAYREYQASVGEFELVDYNNRAYLVRFHSSILEGLLNNETRHVSNPGLLSERSGIAHRLASWCQIMVGVTAGVRDKPRSFLLDELWERMMASSQLNNFCVHFTRLLKRNCINGSDTWNENVKSLSLIYGYYVEYDPDIEKSKELMRIRGRRRRKGGKIYPTVTVWRDSEDLYVGDNSAHNVALRRKLQEMQRIGGDLFETEH